MQESLGYLDLVPTPSPLWPKVLTGHDLAARCNSPDFLRGGSAGGRDDEQSAGFEMRVGNFCAGLPGVLEPVVVTVTINYSPCSAEDAGAIPQSLR